MTGRTIMSPGTPSHDAYDALLVAASGVIRSIVGEAEADLVALMKAGAVVQLRIAMPSGRVALELVRGDRRDVLGAVDPTAMRSMAH